MKDSLEIEKDVVIRGGNNKMKGRKVMVKGAES